MSEYVEAEQSVIGSLFVEPELIRETTLQDVHFSQVAHRNMYQAMQKLDEQGVEIELASVATALGDRLEETGGIMYLTELVSSIATTSAFKHYETMIFEGFKLRASRKLAIKYAEDPDNEALDKLIKQLGEVSETGTRLEEKDLRYWLQEISDDISSPEVQNQNGFATGYSDLDRMTGGFQRQDLIIVAARPSMGKTAFALNVGSNHCRESHRSRTHLFSLEMGAKSLLHRVLSSEGQVDGQRWRSPSRFFTEMDYEKATRAIANVLDWNLEIYENMNSIAEIRSAIRTAVKNHPDDDHLVIIDYLQLIQAVGKYERKDLEVGAITRELKQLARELDIPIIVLSQLSRGVESRQDKRPMMSDLRESGNIEQDADVIAFLFREDYYDKESENQNIIEIILSKQRNGPVGNVELAFIKEYGKFVNLDRRYEQGGD
ncbi:replicative DNA helicase [Geomicrobium sp. JCM 19055]|uniref:replicative DNA helicase n=1 Tax=Geomicrobium sp. JCM 19055 TaxID=1460649 RepID=UPI00045ED0B6|nr:replicative DNA helicase [Geomicrobium sp. JCM 19055]GAK01487.1 replicative DNA helicase [Geomicrobium sp. JCM 19055]